MSGLLHFLPVFLWQSLLDGGLLTAVKLLLVWLLVLAGSAASAHLIAQQAWQRPPLTWPFFSTRKAGPAPSSC